MTWQVTQLSNWSSAGGQPLEDCGLAYAGSSIRHELGGEGTATLILDAEIAFNIARDRTILRVDGPSTPFECRVSSIARPTRGIEGTRFTVTAQPRLYDLADSDIIRQTIGGRTISRFVVNGNAEYYLREFFLPNADDDGLFGIDLGVIEFDQPFPLTIDRWTRGILLRNIIAALNAELNIRIDGDGVERIDLLKFVGSEALTFPLRYGDLLNDHQLAESYEDLCTAARIVGEAPVADGERATIGENQWRVANRRSLGGGAFAVELRAIASNDSPILEDQQYVGQTITEQNIVLPARYLQRADGITRSAIIASSASASEVTVATNAPAIGERVAIVADSTGTPLETLELPASIRRYGYVMRDVAVPGGRGERQYARNGGHESGITGWTRVHGGVGVAIARDKVGVDLTFAANGTRSAGTTNATAFAVDGLTPGEPLYESDQIVDDAATLDITVDAIPDATGALALTVGSPGLPGNYADGDAITLIRRDVRVTDVDGTWPKLGGFARVRGTDLQVLPGVDNIALAGPGGEAFSAPTIFAWPDDPAKLVVKTSGWTGGTPATNLGLLKLVDGSAIAITGTQFSVEYDPSGAPGTIGSYIFIPLRYYLVGGVAPWYDGFGIVASVASVVGTTITCNAIGLPSGVSLSIISFYLVGLGTYPVATSFNDTWNDGDDFTITRAKETRPLLFDGAHTAGDTSLNFQPIAAIATRDWITGDMLYVRRTIAAIIRATAFDGSTGELTISTGLSTIGAIDPADYPLLTFTLDGDFDVGGESVTALSFQVVAVSGSIVTTNVSGITVVTPIAAQTIGDSVSTIAPLTVSSGASWAATGRATVPVTVSVGTTIRAGELVWANWHGTEYASRLRVYDDVVGPASSIEVTGDDDYTAAWDGVTTPLTALYRVFASASVLDAPGNVLTVAATVVANGSGQANVTVLETTVNAIANNAVLRVHRPALVQSTDRQTGSVMRLTQAVSGEPTSDSPGVQCDLAYFRVPAGSTRTITTRSKFWLSAADWLADHGPTVAIVDDAERILAWSKLGDDGILVDTERGEVMLTAQAVIAQSGRYALRVYGGLSSDLTRWLVHAETFFYLGEAADAPYTDDSYASTTQLLAQRAVRDRSTPRITDTLQVEELSLAFTRALGIPDGVLPQITIGGRAHLEDWDRLVRVQAFTERPERAVSELDVGTLAPDGGRLLGASALAAGVRGIR